MSVITMVLSDISVKRPVLAIVMSLLLVALGALAFRALPLRETPDIDPPVVNVETSYRGAPAQVVESRVTQPLEDAVAGISGIELISSVSSNGRSSITIEFMLTRDIESAANDVRDAISRSVAQLPLEVDPPQVAKVDGDADVMMWLNLASSKLDSLQLADYADRTLVDRLSTIDGVARVTLAGAQRMAMRIWLRNDEMAARNLTVTDVIAALRRENIELPAGRIESTTRDFTVRIPRAYNSAEDFAAMVLRKGADGHLLRLGEVARVELGSLEKRAYFRGNGEPQVGLGVLKQSTANALDVSRAVKLEVARIAAELPEGTKMVVAVDTSEFIEAAVNEVYFTLVLTMALVVAVIYLFLGSWRAALIPAVTVPVCVMTSFIFLAAFGFSINLLTLLALILSIGLVVDDAIVVLENCQRRMDVENESAVMAAYRGTRQVAFAVIATTAVLVAVFVPIAFMEGNLGRLFRELAVAIAAAVAVSSFVALSLSPAMCAALLRRQDHANATGLIGAINRTSDVLTEKYRRFLTRNATRLTASLTLLLVSGVSIYGLSKVLPAELAPAEDRGIFFVSLNGPEGAGFDYTVKQLEDVEKRILNYVEQGKVARVNTRAPRGFGGANSEEFQAAQAIVVMPPWNKRSESTQAVMEQITRDLAGVPGLQGFPQMRQGFGRGFGQPVQFVLLGESFEQLAGWRDQLLPELQKLPQLMGVDHDYKETRPQLRVDIDRNRAADLGISQDEIASTLDTMLGSRRVGTFLKDGEEYDVVLQAERATRTNPGDATNLFLRAGSNGQTTLVPLSSIMQFTERAEASNLNRFNRLRALTISARVAPDVTLGQALAQVEATAKRVLPATARSDFKGDSREFKKSGASVAFTFLLALLVVYLVLAAQFESFLHPAIIMMTVPLALAGAMLGLYLLGSSLNLYSQIGMVMLVGLAAKNGILIVEFANQLRDEGMAIVDAAIEASCVRLRPIVMTSVATAVGAMPLIFAHGAGAQSRYTIGVAILFGVVFSTILTLIVVPALYVRLARYTGSPEARAKLIENEENHQLKTVARL
jgi:multidrug efflux pump